MLNKTIGVFDSGLGGLTAVEELSRGGQVELYEERKAAMASNLMVVLCGESEARPVVNTGSLY